MKKKHLSGAEFEEHKKRAEKLLFEYVNVTMWASVVIIGYLIWRAPSAYDAARPYMRVKADYMLMFTQSILGVICMNLPRHLEKQFGVKIPSNMLVLFVIFLYCAIFLGEVRSFYYNVKNWDTMLHFFSAGMLGSLGFSIISIMNSSKRVPFQLSPFFISAFAFCFAVTIGVFWEIYEWTFDGVLGLNMQKFMSEQGVQYVGRAALYDTMKDLITDVIGALAVCIYGYYMMRRYTTKWVDDMQLKREKPVKKEIPADTADRSQHENPDSGLPSGCIK